MCAETAAQGESLPSGSPPFPYAESIMTEILSPSQIIQAVLDRHVDIDETLAAELIDALEAAGWRFVYDRAPVVFA
jgi:hypothetical protein